VRHGVKGLGEIKIDYVTGVFVVKKASPMFGSCKQVGKAGLAFTKAVLGVSNRRISFEPNGDIRVGFFQKFWRGQREAAVVGPLLWMGTTVATLQDSGKFPSLIQSVKMIDRGVARESSF